jgi:hypothetical protein
MKDKNIYEKIQLVKERLLNENIKKSGKNKFAGYEYYELADFTPYIIKFCNEVGLFTKITFDKEQASLMIVNVNKPEEFEVYSSPMEELELKGCNKIQALGGTETYSRRYLYLTAFDIIENDMFDRTVSEPKEDLKGDATKEQKASIKKLMLELNYSKEYVEERFSVEDLNKITKEQAGLLETMLETKISEKE